MTQTQTFRYVWSVCDSVTGRIFLYYDVLGLVRKLGLPSRKDQTGMRAHPSSPRRIRQEGLVRKEGETPGKDQQVGPHRKQNPFTLHFSHPPNPYPIMPLAPSSFLNRKNEKARHCLYRLLMLMGGYFVGLIVLLDFSRISCQSL